MGPDTAVGEEAEPRFVEGEEPGIAAGVEPGTVVEGELGFAEEEA